LFNVEQIYCLYNKSNKFILLDVSIMEKLLYVTANPKGLEKSNGLQIGEAFLESFHEENPDVEIKKMDLFQLDFAQMDADLVSARGKLAGYGYNLDQLSDLEREKIFKMHTLADEFISYDYYVFVSPMWNLNSPAVLNAFLDNLFVSGKTFAHTSNGPKGLLIGKKAIHIQTRGGQYTGTPMQESESGDRYLKIALRFLGIDVLETVVAEGLDLYPQKAHEIVALAKEKAIISAKDLIKISVQI
jgi:FMN-dependent NADH-azoreductase